MTLYSVHVFRGHQGPPDFDAAFYECPSREFRERAFDELDQYLNLTSQEG
jgi:hypothetical protein